MSKAKSNHKRTRRHPRYRAHHVFVVDPNLNVIRGIVGKGALRDSECAVTIGGCTITAYRYEGNKKRLRSHYVIFRSGNKAHKVINSVNKQRQGAV